MPWKVQEFSVLLSPFSPAASSCGTYVRYFSTGCRKNQTLDVWRKSAGKKNIKRKKKCVQRSLSCRMFRIRRGITVNEPESWVQSLEKSFIMKIRKFLFCFVLFCFCFLFVCFFGGVKVKEKGNALSSSLFGRIAQTLKRMMMFRIQNSV